MKLPFLIAFFSLLLDATPSLASTESPVLSEKASLRVLHSNAQITVGSLITLEIEIPHPNKDEPWTIDFAINKKWMPHGPILINTFSLGEPKERTKRIRVKAIVLQKEQQVVPPLTIRKEASSQILQTSTATISAKTNLSKSDKKPIWLLPLKNIPSLNWPLIITAILILTALLSYTLYLILRKKTKPSAHLKPIVLFKKEIKNLSQNTTNWKQFSFDLSLVLRKFLSQHLNTNLLELTDKELIEKLHKTATAPEDIQALGKILLEINEARYYTKELTKEAAKNLIKASEDFAQQLGSKEPGL